MKYKYTGTGNSGTFSWLMQRISGIIITIYATIVFFQIAIRGFHDISSWLLFPLLIAGIWHTFSGFKMITDDYVASANKRFLLYILYWVVGIGVIALGTAFAVM